ncbi:unnamed protein product [Merluccius merluccius]
MAKSMSLLWGSGCPPCWRVRITLEEKRLQGYRRKMLSLQAGEHKSPEVLEINPRGQPDLWRQMTNVFRQFSDVCDVAVLSVERYPKLARYYSLLKGRASIKASWPPYWMESPRGYGVLSEL